MAMDSEQLSRRTRIEDYHAADYGFHDQQVHILASHVEGQHSGKDFVVIPARVTEKDIPRCPTASVHELS